MSSSNKQIIPVLDMFRLIAALFVVLVHYEIIFGRFVIYGSLGTTALSWFFVLSGFIIAYNYPSLDTAADYKKFYVHRFIRIYPVYFLAVLVSALFVAIGFNTLGDQFFTEVRRPFEISYDLPEQKDNAFWTLATLRHLTFTQSISSIETLKLVFNGPLWSLVLEIYFYLTFPIFLYLLRPINTMRRIIAAFIVGYILQFALIQYFLPDVERFDVMNLNVTVYTNPAIRGLEFVFGMLLYKAFVLLPEITTKEKPNLIPLLLTIVAYLAINVIGENYVPYEYSMFFLAVPVVTLLVFTMARSHWYPQGAPYRFCLWAGGISYVLYCFHWPFMEMIQFWDLIPQTIPFPLHLPLLVLVLLAVSHVIYKWVETPMRKFLYRRLDPARASVSH
ncbi:MAG: acyltransferase family protein [Pseudomonadales bacterium]|nr:acyltransferase family protein [Pseudomonadales bacterium]